MSKRTPEAGSPALRRTVKALLRRGGSPALKSLMTKSVAVCSGKGGVGKTITATNLAILFARQSLRVGLVDLDPLSDVATLLDIVEPEAALGQEASAAPPASLAENTLKVLGNLDLLFPNPKLNRLSRETLLTRLFGDFAPALDGAYDLLIFDLPAGSGYEDNLAFLPFMRLVLLVTNPDPPAHVAAGTYIRRAFDHYPQLRLELWHNRYTPDSGDGFDPRDVVGTYNRNVPEEERIAPDEARRLGELAHVPEDPALNLLRGSPGANENILRFLIDTLEYCNEQRLRLVISGEPLPPLAAGLIVSYLSAHGEMKDPPQTLDSLGEYLRLLVSERLPRPESGAAGTGSLEVFTPEQRRSLTAFLDRVHRDPLRRRLLGLAATLREQLDRLESSRGPFAPGLEVKADRAVDRELSALLVELSRQAARAPALGRCGGLLLFYFALYKLFQSPTVTGLVGSLVPTRQDGRGATLRDRNRQIRALVEEDPEYRRRYLKMIRTLYPVVVRQVTHVVKVFGLGRLLLRNDQGGVQRAAYLKLFTGFLHDTLYSGLSVVVGFPYRASGHAFARGARKVLESMGVAGARDDP